MTELRQEPHLIVIYIRDPTKLRRQRQRERQKSTKFYERNNNSARASRSFVPFFAVPLQLRREKTKF